MTRGAASARGRLGRGLGVVLAAAMALGLVACSGGTSTTSTAGSPGTVAGTTVNLRSTGPQSTSSSLTAGIALWKKLKAAGVSATITGFDMQSRFSLTTNDPAKVRQVVADQQPSTTGTTPGSERCPGAEESPTPPDPQPAATTDGGVEVFQTAGALAAGTGGEDAFGGSAIRKITIRPKERPPTVVATPSEASLKKVAADFGPGLIVVTEMFVDPAVEQLAPTKGSAAC